MSHAGLFFESLRKKTNMAISVNRVAGQAPRPDEVQLKHIPRRAKDGHPFFGVALGAIMITVGYLMQHSTLAILEALPKIVLIPTSCASIGFGVLAFISQFIDWVRLAKEQEKKKLADR